MHQTAASVNWRREPKSQQPPEQIEADAEFVWRQRLIARVVPSCCRGLSIREGQRENVTANTLFDSKRDLSFRLISEPDYLSDVGIEDRSDLPHLESHPRCIFKQHGGRRPDSRVNSESERPRTLPESQFCRERLICQKLFEPIAAV